MACSSLLRAILCRRCAPSCPLLPESSGFVLPFLAAGSGTSCLKAVLPSCRRQGPVSSGGLPPQCLAGSGDIGGPASRNGPACQGRSGSSAALWSGRPGEGKAAQGEEPLARREAGGCARRKSCRGLKGAPQADRSRSPQRRPGPGGWRESRGKAGPRRDWCPWFPGLQERRRAACLRARRPASPRLRCAGCRWRGQRLASASPRTARSMLSAPAATTSSAGAGNADFAGARRRREDLGRLCGECQGKGGGRRGWGAG